MSKIFLISGCLFVAVGLVLKFAPWLLNWFGRLPGDIRVEQGHSHIYIPFTSMLIVSVLLTLIVNVFFRR